MVVFDGCTQPPLTTNFPIIDVGTALKSAGISMHLVMFAVFRVYSNGSISCRVEVVL